MKLYFLFLTSWIISIFVGFFVLFPNSDDIFYVLPALNFAEYGKLGVFFGDDFTWKILFNLPTFSFLQGLILFLFNIINIPIDFFTYRLSNSIIVILLIFLFSFFLTFKNKNINTIYNYLTSFLFIGLLGLIPFAQAWMIFRPEPMGLFFLISGLWFFEFKLFKKKIFNIIIGSLFVGLSPALHPVFTLISFSIILIYFFRFIGKNLYINLFILILFSLLPSVILVLFLTKISPEYIKVINEQSSIAVDETKAILGLLQRSIDFFSYQIDWKLKIVNFYYLFYSLVVIISLYVFSVSIKKTIVLKKIESTNYIYLVIILSSLVSLFIFYDHINIHSALSVLLLFSTLGLSKEYINKKFSKLSKRTIYIFFLILLLAPCSWTFLNYFKLEFFPERYSNPSFFTNILNNKIDRTLPLYIISHESAPLMIDKLINPDQSRTFWLFPSFGTIYINNNETRFIENFIEKNIINKRSYWLTREQNNRSQGFKINNDGSICIYIPRSYEQKQIYSIKVVESKIIYKSDKYTLIEGYNYTRDCE